MDSRSKRTAVKLAIQSAERPETANALAEPVGVDPKTAKKHLDQMAEDGEIFRYPVNDRLDLYWREPNITVRDMAGQGESTNDSRGDVDPRECPRHGRDKVRPYCWDCVQEDKETAIEEEWDRLLHQVDEQLEWFVAKLGEMEDRNDLSPTQKGEILDKIGTVRRRLQEEQGDRDE